MIFLDRYALPVWLDPTPLVLERLKRYAYRPVREPFAGNRKEIESIVLTPKQQRAEYDYLRAEKLRERGKKGAKTQMVRAREDAARLGETLVQRLKRQKLESQRRLRAERSAGKPVYSAKGNGARWGSIL